MGAIKYRLALVRQIFVVTALCVSAPTHALSLSQAEQAAISRSSELSAINLNQQALVHQSISAEQFDDPMLKLGAMNLPTDTFNLSQEPMTQMQVGIQQRFPKGRSLRYQSKRYRFLADAEARLSQEMRLVILRDVRTRWLDLYYWYTAKQLIKEQQAVFAHLLKVTESLLANDQSQQKDVIRAQLELTELNNRLIYVDQQIAVTKAALARWIGSHLASKVEPKMLPFWLPVPSYGYLQQRVMHHPILSADSARIASNKSGVQVAKERFKPGYTLGVAYGVRSGINTNGQSRPDFVTGQASIDLPIFPANRQQQDLKQAYAKLYASKSDRLTHLRNLVKLAEARYADCQKLRDSAALYHRHLLPEAQLYADATQIAYQNHLTDFPTLARAHVRNLTVQLDALRTRVAYTRMRVALLYLEGQ